MQIICLGSEGTIVVVAFIQSITVIQIGAFVYV